MSDMLFLAGQIRTMTSTLLTKQQIDRMVGADTVNAAFRVLTELQYATQFDKSLQAKDFALVLEKGLTETKNFLAAGIDDLDVEKLLWLRFDAGNIKRLLKAYVFEGDAALQCLESDEGFVFLGQFDAHDLKGFIEDSDTRKKITYSLQKVFYKALQGDYDTPYALELAIDKAYLEVWKRVGKRRNDDFMLGIYTKLATQYALRSVAHAVLIYNTTVKKEELHHISDTSLVKSHLLETQTPSQMYDILITYGFYTSKKEWDDADNNERVLMVEKIIYDEYMQYIDDANNTAVSGLAIPLWYMETRLKNANIIKTIMLAKFKDMDTEDIYSLIKYI